jgi:hypothetical protein
MTSRLNDIKITARTLRQQFDLSLHASVRFAAHLPKRTRVEACDITTDDDGDTMLMLPGWFADDGNAKIYYADADTGREAAEEYVADGDWGDDGGSIEVRVWRVGYALAPDDEVIRLAVDERWHSVEIAIDHSSLIRAATGGDGCGEDPDDHTWTSEDEGGCDENPGVWSLGGTAMVYRSHCRCCGLTREESDPGSQRNPGDGVTYTYAPAGEEQIERWRASGAMDAAHE